MFEDVRSGIKLSNSDFGENRGLVQPIFTCRDFDNIHNKDTASCLALAMMRFSIICLWSESVCNGKKKNVMP